MKTPILFTALGIALAAALPAHAASDHQAHGSGRYEWRQVPQPGPRATGPSLKRVWVPAHAANARIADCDCDMMKMSADDCMKSMQPMGARSAG